MANIARREDGKWRARYRDAAGRERARHFTRKVDAQRWVDEQTAALVTGSWLDPVTARTTVAQWCARWLEGYGTRRPRTVVQARTHLRRIVAAFGPMPLSTMRPSHVKSWTSAMTAEGLAPSYVHATYRRLAQVMGDAVHDGLIPRSPCSRRTSPAAGRQRPYVATTAQVWALHEAFLPHLRPAVLLGAFVGLRTSEVCGLRLADVDFMRGVVTPVQQSGGEPLKSEAARTALTIDRALALELAASVQTWGGEHVVTNGAGGASSTWAIDRAMRAARPLVEGLPEAFRFHDLRHYLASLLIGSGLDVKVVQHRLRHATASTTLDTYAHLWPDSDLSARAAIGAVLAARADQVRTRGAS